VLFVQLATSWWRVTNRTGAALVQRGHLMGTSPMLRRENTLRHSCHSWMSCKCYMTDFTSLRVIASLRSYVLGSFNARTSSSIVMALNVKSPLPAALEMPTGRMSSSGHQADDVMGRPPAILQHTGCYFDTDGRIRFRPLLAPFERGQVYLLD
jgi:hypothetical protein